MIWCVRVVCTCLCVRVCVCVCVFVCICVRLLEHCFSTFEIFFYYYYQHAFTVLFFFFFDTLSFLFFLTGKYILFYFFIYFTCAGLAYFISLVTPMHLAQLAGVLCILVFMMFSGANPTLSQVIVSNLHARIHSHITNHHLKGVKWVVSLSREKRKRGIATVPLLSGGLLYACIPTFLFAQKFQHSTRTRITHAHTRSLMSVLNPTLSHANTISHSQGRAHNKHE